MSRFIICSPIIYDALKTAPNFIAHDSVDNELPVGALVIDGEPVKVYSSPMCKTFEIKQSGNYTGRALEIYINHT